MLIDRVMHVLSFEAFLETALQSEIDKVYGLDCWHENTISDNLAIRLRTSFKKISLLGSLYPMTLAWEFYRLSGEPESDHGDIGILVSRRLPDGKSMEGAGFLEAKIRNMKSGKFKLPPKQYRRILARSPKTQLLLYDHNAVPVLDYVPDSVPWNWYPYSSHDSRSPVSYGPILPFDLAIAIGQFDGSLYRYCHSFAQQFTRKYFNLLDLDFRAKAIDTVKGVPGKFGSPRIIMALRIASRSDNLPEEVRPNPNLYRAVE